MEPYLVILLGLSFVIGVMGHGRLMEPPARNAMWRFGFPNPINYNDNEVYCGGFGVQFDKNGGKCGVCGDAWDEKEPREHEAGGKYGNGIIGKRYVMGQKIHIEVDLTTNHLGFFELKLCPVKHKKQVVSQACLDEHPLFLADDPTSDRFFIPEDVGKSATLEYEVVLPKEITCRQCVVQWTYHTGNTWAVCGNGTGTIGCGDQEIFRNCADIQIHSNAAGRPPNFSSNPHIYKHPNEPRKLVVRSQVCVATNKFRAMPNMNEWCQLNCLKYPPNCDPSKCVCLDECRGIGKWRDIRGTDIYCQRKCLRYPPQCPSECSCYSAKGGLKGLQG